MPSQRGKKAKVLIIAVNPARVILYNLYTAFYYVCPNNSAHIAKILRTSDKNEFSAETLMTSSLAEAKRLWRLGSEEMLVLRHEINPGIWGEFWS